VKSRRSWPALAREGWFGDVLFRRLLQWSKELHQNGIGPNPLVNWMNVQEVPSLLPPYHAGAAKSKLMTLLREGHNKVRLT
jgi:hypothetical protein